MSAFRISEFAAAEYRRRAALGQAFVNAGRWTRDHANDRLRPWLALALILNADLDALDLFSDTREAINDEIAWRRTRNADGTWYCTESQARLAAADCICPRSVWAPELERARNQACDKLREGDDSAHHLASGLIAMCSVLHFDRNGRHHIAPYIPHIRAAETQAMQEAA